jgi:WD40 repeat protein
VSPDAALIVSGSRNDAVRVWDPQGRQLHKLNGLRDMITDIVFSPDGTHFAAADAPGEIMLWTADGTVLTPVFKAHTGFLPELAFSPDGTRLASGGADNLVKLWGVDGSPQGEPLAGHLAPVQSVAFAPDGKTLASGSLDGTVRVWNLATRAARVLFVGIRVDQVGFIGSQVWVRANGETLLLYDSELRLQATLLLRRAGVLAYTPDGWFFGPAGVERSVRVYDRAGRELDPEASQARYSQEQLRTAVAAR